VKALIFGILFSLTANAARLSDYSHYEFDVRFTNPECREYFYTKPVDSVGGERLKAKPKNAFCTFSDAAKSSSKPESVQYKLLSWIKSSETKEVFFSSLSFSNSAVRAELCRAAERGVKIRFVLDQNTELKEADALAKCGRDGAHPEYVLRGGGEGTGYSHSKFFIFNPQSKDMIRIIFSSGNVSSGTALHHEAWNFVRTSVESHLAQKQICLMDTLWENEDSSKRGFMRLFKECLSQIETPEEEDIQMRVSPFDGDEIAEYLRRELAQSRRLYVMAHRFSMTALVDGISARLKKRLPVQFISDDDLYWAGNGNFPENRNTLLEWNIVDRLMGQGMEARFVETNHWANLFQHNRMIVFDRELLIGSANWTNAGLRENFESFYMVQIPSVVRAYAEQFEYLWGNIATAVDDLPQENVQPRM